MKIAIFDSAWEYTINTPYTDALGGTQSSICYFLEELSSQNHEVYLFNKVKECINIRNVIHIPSTSYLNYINQNNILFDIIIVSCLPHDLIQLKITLNNPKILYCLWTGHDIDQPASQLLKDIKVKDAVDLYMFVSNWQRMNYVRTFNINYNKTIIMVNGIGKPFEKYLDLPYNKKLKSFAYCSIPWRGLSLLEPIFNNIQKSHNDSQLYIYSGMNIYKQEDTDTYDYFKNTKNIFYNKGTSQEELATQLYDIEILTYPNIFPETSCITVLQAMACGCLILTSDLGALSETMNKMGFYIDINIFNFDKESYVNSFTSTLNNIIILSDDMKKYLVMQNKEYIKNNYIWKNICNKFIIDIQNIKNEYYNYLSNIYPKILESYTNNFNKQCWQEARNDFIKLKYFPNINEYYVIILNNGVCNYNLSNINEAKSCFKICKDLKNDFNINKNIALLELQRNNLHHFIKYARNALQFNFDTLLANLLAEKYEMLGLYHEAVALYENIIYIEPDNINCYNNLGNLKLLTISQVDNIDDVIQNSYGKSLELSIKFNENRKKELILSNILFNNLYNWKLSDKEIFTRSCVWYKYFPKEPLLINIASNLNRKTISLAKKRIGYISCDFITHPVGFMFESILKNHDTNIFEIFCFDCCDIGKSIGDGTSKRLREYNNATWYDISTMSDQDALTVIINNDLDILIDMMGHTRNTRMNLLQYKPARIVVSYFAYPATNGLNEIDYRFTDKYATPPECQQYFVEKLYYLPKGFQCYTPPIEIEAKKDYTRTEKYTIHLACYNNPIKLSIPTIDLFCTILKKLPEAKLFLRYCYYKSSYYRETIYKLFTDRGIDREQVDIGHESIIDALKFYNKIDICLDSFPYHGGTISSELLYMSTPMITLAGTNYVSRVGVSLLSHLGLEKYIANTNDEYVDKTVALARNPMELKLLHKTIRSKFINSELYDSAKFTKTIETAYCDMCSKYNCIL